MQKKSKYALERSPLFGLTSRSRLAALLKLSNQQLRRLGSHREDLYSEFLIEKTSGGAREIENPVRLLKAAQARIARLLARIEPIKHLFCPVKGRSYVDNAATHLKSGHVHCLEIQKFFPSVSSRRVFWFFSSVMHCEKDIAGLLTALSTFKQHLPTGSPLSPILAYYCYLDMWESIVRVCDGQGCRLSIYVDDITVSADTIVLASDIWEIKRIIASYGLKYHKERDFKHKPALITGCIVHEKKLFVPHVQYKKRRLLNDASTTEIDPLEKEKIDRRLHGLRVQMKQISAYAQRPPHSLDSIDVPIYAGRGVPPRTGG